MTDSQTPRERQTVALGLGTGRCGTHSLTDILNRQPSSSFTHEEWPLLPWRHLRGHPGIVERLRRIRRRPATFVGDVASFYLPYAEEAIAREPNVRMICLERTREDVVASFGRWLDAVHPLPTNHWSCDPAPGWYHEPFWTRMFPQYHESDRAAGIRLYWDEYHRTAADLARRYPLQFRVFSVEALNSEAGLRELLTFAGVPHAVQAVEVGTRHGQADESVTHWRHAAASTPDLGHPAHCVVLVPYTTAIVPQCEAALRELENRGYEVRRACATESLDLLRSRMATVALLDGFHEFMWIGPDIGFVPEDVVRLRAHGVPIACGIYAQLGRRTLNCRPLPGTSQLLFGTAGGLHEVEHAGGGFLLVRRPVLI